MSGIRTAGYYPGRRFDPQNASARFREVARLYHNCLHLLTKKKIFSDLINDSQL